MPLTIPPFSQFQGQLIPLRGLWDSAPVEGDRFLNAEIDWLTSTGNLTAQQFSVGGNSPVSLSQIVALYVDNSRCGSDVSFIFPDSAFELVCPAHNQVLAPVLTNALMFYAVANNANAGDVTVLQILNSLPPPIPIAPSVTQNHASPGNVTINPGGTNSFIPQPINGTLNSLALTATPTSGASGTGSFLVTIQDNAIPTPHVLWSTFLSLPASTTQTFQINVNNLNVRFTNGTMIIVSGTSNIVSGLVTGNCYYSTP